MAAWGNMAVVGGRGQLSMQGRPALLLGGWGEQEEISD